MNAPENALAAGGEFRMFAAGDIRDVLAETTELSVGDRNRVAWQIVDVLAEWVAREKTLAWDEGYAHCFDEPLDDDDAPARSLNDNPYEKDQEADRG